jgi:hypothetical protein
MTSLFLRSLLAITLSVSSMCVFSDIAPSVDSKAIQQQADEDILQLYHSFNGMPTKTLSARIDAFSASFLEKPYLLGALGEGPHARYDQYPRYRTDGFDCETYVDTIVALVLADNLHAFQNRINQIRYHNGQVSFIARNHFTSLDWNPNNQAAGFVKDITNSLHNDEGQSVALTAEAMINKPGWYNLLPLSTIRLLHAPDSLKTTRLLELKHKGEKLPQSIARIPYIPLTALFQDNIANMHLFNQIPNGAIIEIVRPNWDLEKTIGTHLNVSHMGLAIWKNGELIFRNASSRQMRVTDQSLIDYLRDTQQSPTIKGINIQIICPKQQTSCT